MILEFQNIWSVISQQLITYTQSTFPMERGLFRVKLFHKRANENPDREYRYNDFEKKTSSSITPTESMNLTTTTANYSLLRKSFSCRDFFKKLSHSSTGNTLSKEVNTPHTNSEVYHTPVIINTALTQDTCEIPNGYPSISLDTISLNNISFEDNVISRSTTNSSTTTSASVTDADIQIYRPAEVKMIEMVDKEQGKFENEPGIEQVSNSPDSITPISHIISSYGIMEHELLHEVNTPINRLEMMKLVEKHQSIAAKQAQEIAHLKKLLIQQQQLNRVLMMSAPKNHSNLQGTKETKDENLVHRHKIRPSFFPSQVDEGGDKQQELLPPFAWKRADQDSKSDNECHLDELTPLQTFRARKESITSEVSSIMSSSHQNNQRKVSDSS